MKKGLGLGSGHGSQLFPKTKAHQGPQHQSVKPTRPAPKPQSTVTAKPQAGSTAAKPVAKPAPTATAKPAPTAASIAQGKPRPDTQATSKQHRYTTTQIVVMLVMWLPIVALVGLIFWFSWANHQPAAKPAQTSQSAKPTPAKVTTNSAAKSSAPAKPRQAKQSSVASSAQPAIAVSQLWAVGVDTTSSEASAIMGKPNSTGVATQSDGSKTITRTWHARVAGYASTDVAVTYRADRAVMVTAVLKPATPKYASVKAVTAVREGQFVYAVFNHVGFPLRYIRLTGKTGEQVTLYYPVAAKQTYMVQLVGGRVTAVTKV
ncbi:hypothetical protein [Lacticaseibacillus nasuensis]|uniref:hypothetical protein n=1 Tax=Lacticaseibacillus nasuensis TaxID=944671 RepID=UPI0022456479|nr:hypothetical protein [Lacticaseibacillus nasuensis]MCX2456148.1 hypothetical protein [Lacticaseibacillus nasuensis]